MHALSNMTVATKSPLLAAFIASCLAVVSGFMLQPSSLPSVLSSHGRRRCCLKAANDEYSDALAHNIARTCVRTFLTQRAIQSFMFLLESCRDPHTVTWFEVRATFGSKKILTKLRSNRKSIFACLLCFDFLFECQENFGLQSFDQYHGTGAFNTTKYGSWDAVLLDILSRPKQVIVIRAKRRGRGHGGWSKENPYLPDVSILAMWIRKRGSMVCHVVRSLT